MTAGSGTPRSQVRHDRRQVRQLVSRLGWGEHTTSQRRKRARLRFALFGSMLIGVSTVASVALVSEEAGAQTAVLLGTAGSYAVIAGAAVTNTGPSVLNTGLALSPGTSVSGFPPGVINGADDVTDAAASLAQTDLTTAYNQAAGEGPAASVSASILGSGQSLSPGVYNASSSIDLSPDLERRR